MEAKDPGMEAWERRQLAELRKAVGDAVKRKLPGFEEDCFSLDDEVRESTVTLALAVTEARERCSGIWADETFETRANMVGVWLARLESVGIGAEAFAVCRAYDAWLERIERESGPRAAEMLTRLSFWVTTCDLDTSDEGLRIARRAMPLATTPLDEAMAQTQVGFALSRLGRRSEADCVLAHVMKCAPDETARLQAQYHHASLAQWEGDRELVITRYLDTFYALEGAGALSTDLGWSVATELIGFLRMAKDPRARDVEHTYRLALATDISRRAEDSGSVGPNGSESSVSTAARYVRPGTPSFDDALRRR